MPLVSVTATEALAGMAGNYPGPVIALLDARRGQIYGQWFGAPVADGPRPAGPLTLCAPEDLPGIPSVQLLPFLCPGLLFLIPVDKLQRLEGVPYG